MTTAIALETAKGACPLSVALDLVLIPLVLALNALACDLSKTGATPSTDNEFRGTSRR